jgi:hypothetical protein
MGSEKPWMYGVIALSGPFGGFPIRLRPAPDSASEGKTTAMATCEGGKQSKDSLPLGVTS